MVSLLVRFKFAPEDRVEVADLLRILTAETRKEPGCVSYTPHPLQEDPDTILIYEQYRDEQALTAHRESPHFKKYAAGGLYQKMRERNLQNLIDIV
ncbi:MAG TPA: putative quinol monooxygenase [Terracidiphilus sp.]|nr:putative quinol monooxygenase [Terracidiphilus sp.]